MVRLFTATAIKSEIREFLSLKQVGLKNIRWIKSSDFHITICFIGDVDLSLANEIDLVLKEIKINKTIDIEIDRLDIFGKKVPHSLVAMIKENQALDNLRKMQIYRLEQLGLKMEKRKYLPHITIGRFIKSNIKGQKYRANEIANYLAQNNFTKPIKFSTKEYCLFSAKQSIGGGPYKIEQIY